MRCACLPHMVHRLQVLQGLGRHALEYIVERMNEELGTCNSLLEASGAFLTGDTPCLADCYLFSMVEMVRF